MNILIEKLTLYHALLLKKKLTDNEVDIMYSLSIDKEVQNFITERISGFILDEDK